MNTPELTTAQSNSWSIFQRMRTRLTAQINRELARETGLSEADFVILTALLDHSDQPVRAMALRCGIDWEKSRLSHQLRRMEQRGLVDRGQCAEDDRGAMVQLTDTGRSAAEAARLVHEQAVHRYVCSALTPGQLTALGEIAEAVLATLGDAQWSCPADADLLPCE